MLIIGERRSWRSLPPAIRSRPCRPNRERRGLRQGSGWPFRRLRLRPENQCGRDDSQQHEHCSRKFQVHPVGKNLENSSAAAGDSFEPGRIRRIGRTGKRHGNAHQSNETSGQQQNRRDAAPSCCGLAGGRRPSERRSAAALGSTAFLHGLTSAFTQSRHQDWSFGSTASSHLAVRGERSSGSLSTLASRTSSTSNDHLRG